MILIIEGIQQILMKRMEVIEFWKRLQYLPQLLAKCLLGELDFAEVEGADTADFEAGTDLCWELSLRPGEDDV